MATILCIETSSTTCSVAISINGECVALVEQHAVQSHNRLLQVMVEDLLHQSNLSFSNLNAIAVSLGPGSYTGLRIGLSAAKGYAFGLDIPLIGIATIEAIADYNLRRYKDQSLDCCFVALKSIKTEIYGALYDSNLKVKLKIDAYEITNINLLEYINNSKLVICGSGIFNYNQLVKRNNVIFAASLISGKYLCFLAEKRFNDNSFDNTNYVEPLYLKRVYIGKKTTFKKRLIN